MTMQTPPQPVPPTLIDCPWCGAPVGIRPEAAALECDGCLVRVELAVDVPPGVGLRRAAGPRAPASRIRVAHRPTRPAVPSAA